MRYDEATYIATILVMWETWNRYRSPALFQYVNIAQSKSMTIQELENTQTFHLQQPVIILWIIAVNLLFTILHVSIKMNSSTFFQSSWFHNVAPYLYVLDPITALLLGYSIYSVNTWLFVISAIMLCNFFLIRIIQISILKKNMEPLNLELIETLKHLIHHLSSFMFIEHDEVILITCVWRSITMMSGHMLQGLYSKKLISSDLLQEVVWSLSNVRNVLLLGVSMRVAMDTEVQRGFAKSAIGHIAYMIVRGGLVFRQGTIYVTDKVQWQSYNDWKRLWLTLTFHNPFIRIEIWSLFLFSAYLLYLRFYYF